MKTKSLETSTKGYLAVPTSGGGPGVIVVHAWWGLTEFFRQVCDRLAKEGFLSYAPDLFSGSTARTIEQAKRLRSKLNRKAGDQKVAQAVDYLCSRSNIQGDRIGVMGFSLGAGFALTAARSRTDTVRAVVVFYGTGGGKFDRVNAAFMGHFAENDEWGAGPEKVNSLHKRLVSARKKASFYTYPHTQHWFFEENVSEAYDRAAAKLAWNRTVEFLREQIG